MTLEKAFEHLIENWDIQGKLFIKTYKSYKSKYLAKKAGTSIEGIGKQKMLDMLRDAGYSENFQPPKPKKKK
jgi:hypothetical protein